MTASSPSSYELELVFQGDPSTAVTASFKVPLEAQLFAGTSIGPNSVLTVAHMKGGDDLGNFLVFVNREGLAHVRLLEHQGFYAKRVAALPTGRQVAFVSDVGSTFHVDEIATVPLETAVEALNHWLFNGNCLPTIPWGEE